MRKKQSLRSKAAHLVSDLTTVLLNPISDNKPSKASLPSEESQGSEREGNRHDNIDDDDGDLIDGPDTSSFSAFLFSLLSSSDNGKNDDNETLAVDDPLSKSVMRENIVLKKSFFSRSKQSLGRAIYQAATMGGFRNQNGNDNFDEVVEMTHIRSAKDPVVSLVDDGQLPQISEPSMLIEDSIRNAVYASLPALIHGRKWMLLYSTWKHGISLSTLYRRSTLWPGLSLLVVGDRKGAVFGGLVEAPLIPSNKRKYQGTNNSFVFTNICGHPVIYRPTGINRYFTLCTTDFLAIGGGGHFALYLDGDLLDGSSSVSETYGNPCLAHSQDFEVKEVELWGFVFPSKYEEIAALSRTEAPGICRW